MTEEENKFNLLGESKQTYPSSYSPEILESFSNCSDKHNLWVSFLCTEFTALCPITSQPDFARIYINYIPNLKMLESKSLKIYLYSFRNKGSFHETCAQTICDDLVSLLNPHYLEVIGEFTPRGGISIFPFVSYADEKHQD
jgi:7-cyano-7-deazaguanine reductase